VLNFAKLEAGAIQYRFADVPFDGVLNDLEPMVALQARNKGLAYRCIPPEAGVTAWTDREKLEQILLNLISNAIKFTTAGHVELRCATLAHEIRITVADTGPGIPPELQQSIFEPFVRGERALTRTAEGTGLGLAISRQLARAMGSDIDVQSGVGAGSVFTLALPRSRGADRTVAMRTGSDQPEPQVDDRYAASPAGERERV
jgi:signal transduction histidine kinase